MSKRYKTEYQIKALLDNYSYNSENDRVGIEAVCKQQANYNLPKGKAHSNLPAISFQQFSDWFDNGVGSGDIILLNNSIALVGPCTLDTLTLIATITDGQLNITPTNTPASNIQYAEREQREIMAQKLVEIGQQYEPEHCRLSDRMLPAVGHYFYFSNEDFRGIGAFKSYDPKTNRIYTFCHFTEPAQYGTSISCKSSKEVKYLAGSFIEDANSYTLVQATLYESNLLQKALAPFHKKYNGNLRRVEPINMRVKRDEKFFKVSDQLKVVVATEKENLTSNRLFWAGNYFTDRKEAEKAAEYIQAYLKDRLSK